MKRIVPGVTAALGLMLLMTAPLDAQRLPIVGDRALSLEVRGGYALPIADFSDQLGAEADFGWGAGATLMLAQTFGVYGGWSQDLFDCEACGSGERIRVSGWEAGGTFLLPQMEGVSPWIRAGAIWHRANFEFDVAEFESPREWGFQGAVGFDAPLGDWFAISPSVRYNTISPEFDLVTAPPVDLEATADIQYFSFDLAAKFLIPRDL